jgi:hypothetical protein
MPVQFTADQDTTGNAWINRIIARLCTFVLATTASLAITLGTYTEALSATHLGVILGLLIALHLIWVSRFMWDREFTLYACFVGYMFIALLWTHDVGLAMNTALPAVNCLLVMMYFGSLVRFHNVPTVLVGALCGFLVGAAIYTLTQGFPFSYPQEFPYNAIAGMYLFGLFITLMYSCLRPSHNFVLLALAVVIVLHIVATTSIKANLGVGLGLVAAGAMYFRHFGRLLRRKILTLVILGSALGFAVASNDTLVDSMARGVQRVTVGVHVLQTREDVSGYSAFEKRDYWSQQGMEGWKLNPIFGYGTEAFRNDHGITSHSTPIDLLYNYGLIGFTLFYGVLASLMWRLMEIKGRQLTSQRSLMFAGVICYVFMSLSGTLHYSSFLAAFIGISVALLNSHEGATASTSVPRNHRVGRQ